MSDRQTGCQAGLIQGSCMGSTLDLGSRIELVSMDPHFRNITIGLNQQQRNVAPEYLIHSYSGIEGTGQRLDFLTRAMEVLGGLQVVDGRLRFQIGRASCRERV